MRLTIVLFRSTCVYTLGPKLYGNFILRKTLYCRKNHYRPRCGAAQPARLHHQRAHAYVHIFDPDFVN